MTDYDEKIYNDLKSNLYEGRFEEMEKANKEILTSFPMIVMDYGGKNFEEIITCDYKEIILKNSINFAKDSHQCEWIYLIDLDIETFEIYKGDNRLSLEEYDRFYFLQDLDEEYKPPKLKKGYYLNKLPNQKDFIENLNECDGIQISLQNMIDKNERVSLNIDKKDLLIIKRKATENGIPYESLISILIHQYAEGKIILSI